LESEANRSANAFLNGKSIPPVQASAGGVSLAQGVGTLLLNQYLQEHYADYRREGVREQGDWAAA
jgi:hypothetical protein